MNDTSPLGPLLEAFVNKVSHPRGLALGFLGRASVTTPQVILLDVVRTAPHATPSSLAATTKMSLPSVSQMVERLVKLGLSKRLEDPEDRRRKTVTLTPRGRAFLARLQTLRSAEFAAGTSALSAGTRRQLAVALTRALDELAHVEAVGRAPANSRRAS